jgi:hypothetical protein
MSVHLVGDVEVERLVQEVKLQRQRELREQEFKKQQSAKRFKLAGSVLAILFSPIVGGLTYSLAHLMFGNESISVAQGWIGGGSSFTFGFFYLMWHTMD